MGQPRHAGETSYPSGVSNKLKLANARSRMWRIFALWAPMSTRVSPIIPGRRGGGTRPRPRRLCDGKPSPGRQPAGSGAGRARSRAACCKRCGKRGKSEGGVHLLCLGVCSAHRGRGRPKSGGETLGRTAALKARRWTNRRLAPTPRASKGPRSGLVGRPPSPRVDLRRGPHSAVEVSGAEKRPTGDTKKQGPAGPRGPRVGSLMPLQVLRRGLGGATPDNRCDAQRARAWPKTQRRPLSNTLRPGPSPDKHVTCAVCCMISQGGANLAAHDGYRIAHV